MSEPIFSSAYMQQRDTVARLLETHHAIDAQHLLDGIIDYNLELPSAQQVKVKYDSDTANRKDLPELTIVHSAFAELDGNDNKYVSFILTPHEQPTSPDKFGQMVHGLPIPDSIKSHIDGTPERIKADAVYDSRLAVGLAHELMQSGLGVDNSNLPSATPAARFCIPIRI